MPGMFDGPTVGDGPLSTVIRGPSDIAAANRRIFVARDGFEHAYDCIRLGKATEEFAGTGLPRVVRLSFSYHNRPYEAFAYGALPEKCEGPGTGALVIPGSGLNQATAVLQDPSNYQRGLIEGLDGLASTFVLLKPNEDAIAWHDGGGKKLSGTLLWNWHLNRGGSYSVSYLVQSMAFTKYLRRCFSRTIVAGVSQGGAATLLVSLQANPTGAIVAAGHSVLFDDMEWSGHNQLIGVPGYARLFRGATLREALAAVSTRWLFTWGKTDTDFYRVESRRGLTSAVMRDLPNVDVLVHDAGHEIPAEATRTFVSDLTRP